MQPILHGYHWKTPRGSENRCPSFKRSAGILGCFQMKLAVLPNTDNFLRSRTHFAKRRLFSLCPIAATAFCRLLADLEAPSAEGIS